MGRKKRSIRTIILVIILSGLIPINVLGLVVYGFLYSYVKETILETYQESLNNYGKQLDASIKNTENYALYLLYELEWDNLAGQKGEHVYELAKVKLLRELSREVNSKSLGAANALYCAIDDSEEYIFAYNNITYEESLALRSWEKEAPVEGWKLYEIEGEKYFHWKCNNQIFHLGVFMKLDTLLVPWEQISEFEMTFDDMEKEAEDYVLTYQLSNVDATLHLKIPASFVERTMPVQLIFQLLLVLAGFLVIAVLLLLLKRYLTNPLVSMSETIRNIQAGNKEQRIRNCDITRETKEIETSFNSLMDQIYHLEISNYEMEIENQKAQLMNLQMQINPHLLLNTLNTIYGLAEIEEYESIQNFTMNLTKYFRYALKRTDELVTVGQELDFVRSYVEVQKIRYPDSFYVLYHVEDDILAERIPPLIIENFVENSIKYALGKRMTEVLVIIRKKEGFLNISICDDGIGMKEEVLEEIRKGKPYENKGESHVGIYNCIRRLRLFYGESFQVSITSKENEGTQIWMELPRLMEQGGSDETVDCR